MIEPREFHEALEEHGFSFYAGIPDSLLKDLCAYISDHVPADRHIITANEGGAVAVAAGYHLATGAMPVVYLQNSGTGNIVNPLLSLADPSVYRIPILFLIGWRGEPGVADEPQHATQGRVMPELLAALGLDYDIVDADTDPREVLARARDRMAESGSSSALLVRKGAFASYGAEIASDAQVITRSEAVTAVLSQLTTTDLVISTTGMTSREVFAYRARRGEGHGRDFLTVGSMGHCSQIALGVAEQRPGRQVFCLDGDGSVIMHMGGLAIIGGRKPANLKHIVVNNGAHDSVGGQPTAGRDIDFPGIALACGYRQAESIDSIDDVPAAMERLRGSDGPAMLELRVGSRAMTESGRPTKSPLQNKVDFMAGLRNAPD